ncbi:MAG: PE-PPE domain-containing protein [Mycolicibacterium sp.]|uniref:PE-PPE domain-containing protein n=1 Tax=Mycolicibacterium sp. TaxID=2320850 RepID=UPI003D0E50DC
MRRRFIRSAVAALLAASITVLLTLATVFASAFAFAATALIMGGNSHPLSVPQDTTEFITAYVGAADSEYIAPSELCGGTCDLIAVYTPEEFKFVTGFHDLTFDQSVAVGEANLDDCIRGVDCVVTLAPYTETGQPQPVSDSTYVVYSYSESATIATNQKLGLIAHPVESEVSFIMVANPNRPHGGILERFVGVHIPILGVTFNGATPTFSPEPAPLTTIDVARQYDGWADFPTNPLNLPSVVNALMGTHYVHGDYFGVGTPQLQGQFQDATYYLTPTPIVPLLMPLQAIPFLGTALAVTLDPAVRVMVETGYDRTINPGKPTPAKYLYIPNVIKTAVDLVVAIPTGWDDGISYLTGDPNNRPFHTKRPDSPFGVGGPPVFTGAIDPYGAPTPYLTAPGATSVDAEKSSGAQPGLVQSSDERSSGAADPTLASVSERSTVLTPASVRREPSDRHDDTEVLTAEAVVSETSTLSGGTTEANGDVTEAEEYRRPLGEAGPRTAASAAEAAPDTTSNPAVHTNTSAAGPE